MKLLLLDVHEEILPLQKSTNAFAWCAQWFAPPAVGAFWAANPRVQKRCVQYHLTGLAKCAQCGGSLYVRTSSRKGGQVQFYGCMTHHLRGMTACPNSLLTPMGRANEELLAMLERGVLHPDVTKAFVEILRQIQGR